MQLRCALLGDVGECEEVVGNNAARRHAGAHPEVPILQAAAQILSFLALHAEQNISADQMISRQEQ